MITTDIENIKNENTNQLNTSVEVKPENKGVNHNIKASFGVMGIGMFGIFVFMIVFFSTIKLLERIFHIRPK